MGKSQSAQRWGFEELGMASQGDKFDKELMETVNTLIKSLRLLGQMGEGPNWARWEIQEQGRNEAAQGTSEEAQERGERLP